MDDHEHTPECYEAAKQYRLERAAGLMSAYDSEKRAMLLDSTRTTVGRLRKAFADDHVSDEVLGGMAEIIAHLLGQLVVVPAYELSDILVDSTAMYTLASAHMLAGFELPESDEATEEDAASRMGVFLDRLMNDDLPEDFRPGNYL